VCFVRYAFEHRTIECNETFHKYSTHLEEGRHQFFSPKKCYSPLLRATCAADR